MIQESHSILIVDDEIQNIELAEIILKKEGYTLYFALNAKEAFEVVEKHSIDVIVLDLMLPDIDGFEILQTLKAEEKNSHIKVIVVSALHDEESISKATLLGANGYLTKPYDIISLKSRVKEMLQESKYIQMDIETYLDNLFKKVSLELNDEMLRKLSISLLENEKKIYTSTVLKFLLNFSQQTLHVENFYLVGDTTKDTLQSALNKLIVKEYSKGVTLELTRVFKESKRYFLVD